MRCSSLSFTLKSVFSLPLYNKFDRVTRLYVSGESTLQLRFKSCMNCSEGNIAAEVQLSLFSVLTAWLRLLSLEQLLKNMKILFGTTRNR